MGRLIDADVLKESLKKVTIVIDEDVLKCETLNDELLYLLERVEAEMKKKIDECLTAFDIEAVVKELEELKPDIECFDEEEEFKYAIKRHNEYIEIIRKGGVNHG